SGSTCEADGSACTIDRCDAGACHAVSIVPGCVEPAQCCEPSNLFGECALEFRPLSSAEGAFLESFCNGTYSVGSCNPTCGPAVACCAGVTSSSCGGPGGSFGIYGSVGQWDSICSFCGGTLHPGRCLDTACGDGDLDPGEECDDGNGNAS